MASRAVFLFTVAFSLGFGATSRGLAGNFEVIPLNKDTAAILKRGPLAKNLTSLDQSEKDFQQKTFKASQRMAGLFDEKKLDALDFIYDSHFLKEKSFFKKYSSVPKKNLVQARKIASEVYSQVDSK